MDGLPDKKINKKTVALCDILGQVGLTDIVRAFHPKAAEYAFFSSAHRTFPTLAHKTSISKFKKIEIISSFFFDHNDMN